MDKKNLKEEILHGTMRFPLAVYRQETDDKFAVKHHWHDETEIIFLKRGIFKYSVNMKSYCMQSPAFLFIGAGDIHAISGEQGCRESAVVFDMQMLSFAHTDSVQYRILEPLLERRMQYPAAITQKHPHFKDICGLYEKILEEAEEMKMSSRLKVKACLYEMIAILYEDGSFLNMLDASEESSDQVENVKKVLSYINNCYRKKITNGLLAEILGMNEQYFCRYFKKVIGKTPTAYINEVRIERAAGLLQNTNRKILDIAMECGYDNMGYFIKRFREHKKVLPSEYRKMSI